MEVEIDRIPVVSVEHSGGSTPDMFRNLNDHWGKLENGRPRFQGNAIGVPVFISDRPPIEPHPVKVDHWIEHRAIALVPWHRQAHYAMHSNYESYLLVDQKLFDEIGMEGVIASLEMYLAETEAGSVRTGKYK